MQRGDITIAGALTVFRDLKIRFQEVKGADMRIEKIKKTLQKRRRHILLIDHLLGPRIAHTRVIYGVAVVKGLPKLTLMDPLSGFIRLDFGRLQASTDKIAFAVSKT